MSKKYTEKREENTDARDMEAMGGLNKDEVDCLLSQVKQEFEYCETTTLAKRRNMLNNWKMYNNSLADKENKISTKRIYSNIWVNIALNTKTRVPVMFTQANDFDTSIMSNWQRMAEHDFQAMRIKRKERTRLLYRNIFGSCWTVFEDYKSKNKMPTITMYHPMQIIADPKAWDDEDDYRFIGIQTMHTETSLEKMGFTNIDKFKPLAVYNWNMYNPRSLIRGNAPEDRKDEDGDEADSVNRYVMFWYTEYEGNRYQVAVNGDMTHIGRIVKIEKVLDEEKDDIAMRPIVRSAYREEPYNPYCMSYVDALSDIQIAENQLVNLALIKTKRASLGGTTFFDKNKVGNTAQLTNLTTEPRYIGIDVGPGGQISNYVMKVANENVPDENYKERAELASIAKNITGIDPQTMGLASPGAQTAEESKILQSNSNVILGIDNDIDNDYWARFYILYYKWHKSNFSRGKKIITYETPLGDQVATLSFEDLKTKSDPIITIVNSMDKKKRDQEMIPAYQYMLGILQQEDPSSYPYNYVKRKIMELYGESADIATLVAGIKPEEVDAKMKIILINNDEPVDVDNDGNSTIDIENEDHKVYLAYYSNAQNTPAKFKAIQGRLEALKQQGIMRKTTQMAQQQGGQTGNMAGAQMVNNAIQQSQSNAETPNIGQAFGK